tara:strand:+ start:2585 stop:3067 length:483 start_codon:yes stop_codon:yes gene_type:complete
MGLLSSVMGRVSNAFGGLGGGQAGNTANMLSDLDSKYGTSVLGFINNPAVVKPTGMVDSATMLKQINQQAGVQDASGMLSGTGLPSLATPQMPSLADVDPRKAMNKGSLEEEPQPAYSELGQQMLDSYSGLVEPVSAGMSDYEKQMNAIRSGMLDSRVIR